MHNEKLEINARLTLIIEEISIVYLNCNKTKNCFYKKNENNWFLNLK